MSNLRRHLPFAASSKPPPGPPNLNPTASSIGIGVTGTQSTHQQNRTRYHSGSGTSHSRACFNVSNAAPAPPTARPVPDEMVHQASDLMATYSDFLKVLVAFCGTGNLLSHFFASSLLSEMLSLKHKEMAQKMKDCWEDINIHISDKVATMHTQVLIALQEWLNTAKTFGSAAYQDDLAKILNVCLATFVQIQQLFSLLGDCFKIEETQDLGMLFNVSQAKKLEVSTGCPKVLGRSLSLDETIPTSTKELTQSSSQMGDFAEIDGSQVMQKNEGPGFRRHLAMLFTRVGGRCTQSNTHSSSPQSFSQFYVCANDPTVDSLSGTPAAAPPPLDAADEQIQRRLSYSGPCPIAENGLELSERSDDSPAIGRRWSAPGTEGHIIDQFNKPSQTKWYLGLSSLSLDANGQGMTLNKSSDSDSCECCLANELDLDRVICLLSQTSLQVHPSSSLPSYYNSLSRPFLHNYSPSNSREEVTAPWPSTGPLTDAHRHSLGSYGWVWHPGGPSSGSSSSELTGAGGIGLNYGQIGMNALGVGQGYSLNSNSHKVASRSVSWPAHYSHAYSWGRADSCSSSEEGSCGGAVTESEIAKPKEPAIQESVNSFNRRRHSSGGTMLDTTSSAENPALFSRTRSIDDIGNDTTSDVTTSWPIQQSGVLQVSTSLPYSPPGMSIWTPAPVDYSSVGTSESTGKHVYFGKSSDMQ